MNCHECHTKDERIRELEAKVRYLESQTNPMFPIEYKNPPHPDLDTHIDWKEDELSHSDRKW